MLSFIAKGVVFFTFFLFSNTAVPLNVFAAPPSGGSILREEEQQRAQQSINKMKFVSPEEIKAEPELEKDSDIKIFIKKINFIGYDSLISLEELNKIAAPYIKKEVTLTDLNRLTYSITKYLRERTGFLLSRAYLPEQDATAGIIKIVIVPGSLDGKIDVSVIKPSRIKESLLENIANNAVSEEKTIRSKDVERAVLLINELPGLSSRAYLDKGKSPGTTKLSIEAKEGRWTPCMIYGDNFGNDSTGSFRRIAQVSFSDSLNCGDILQLTYINSDYLNQGVGRISFPVGSRGLFVDLSCNGLSYKLKGDLKDLDADGYAIISNVAIKYPIILRRKANLWISGGYDYYHLNDRFSKTPYSKRDINAGSANIKGNFYDGFFGGGLNYFLASFNGGSVDISAGEDLDDAGAKTDGSYFRASYLAARLQKITQNISLLFSSRGQISSCNLDTSQKIILGGPTGVRAYPVGEAAADEGNILTLETRLDVPFMPSWFKTQLVGFYDAGYAVLHKDTWRNSVTNATDKNRYWLQGAGPGINIEKKGLYRVQSSYAFKIGRNDGRDIFGDDSNGKDDNGQFWIQGTIWF